MPGINIHLAVAKKYIEKHKNEIKNENEFLKGTLKPDLNDDLNNICEDKIKSHYIPIESKNDVNFVTDLKKFFYDNKENINTDFYRGYFLHLISDDYFYNKYFYKELCQLAKNNDKFYYDYDCLNKMIEEKYNIELTENLKNLVGYINKTPKYLSKDKVIEFIEEMSNINLNEEIEKIKY